MSTCTAFAYGMLADARPREPATEAQSLGPKESVLHARVLLLGGRYELNVAFTPDGQIRHFHISSVPAKVNARDIKA